MTWHWLSGTLIESEYDLLQTHSPIALTSVHCSHCVHSRFDINLWLKLTFSASFNQYQSPFVRFLFRVSWFRILKFQISTNRNWSGIYFIAIFSVAWKDDAAAARRRMNEWMDIKSEQKAVFVCAVSYLIFISMLFFIHLHCNPFIQSTTVALYTRTFFHAIGRLRSSSSSNNGKGSCHVRLKLTVAEEDKIKIEKRNEFNGLCCRSYCWHNVIRNWLICWDFSCDRITRRYTRIYTLAVLCAAWIDSLGRNGGMCDREKWKYRHRLVKENLLSCYRNTFTNRLIEIHVRHEV